MLFGNTKPRNPWDPAPMGAMPPSGPPPLPWPPAAAPVPAPEAYKGPGTLRTVAGSIGDALMALGHLQPTFAANMQAQRQHAQDLADEQRKASMQMDTWTKQQEYKAAHPDPVEPDVFTRTLSAAGIDPNSPEGKALYKQRATTMALPFVPDGLGGGHYAQPAPAGPQVGAIVNGHRFKGGNPNDPSAWEAVGGPTQPASGNFRHP